ncbi:MAG TPA: hypothetical protein DEW35_03930 [Ruminococcaceae bacterium]|nr:hypothetical protein [Oscillospiraceae bacterium]
MEILAKYKNAVSALFGDTKLEKGKEYRLATYSKLLKYEGKHLLYNNLSKTLYLLDEKEGAEVESMPVVVPAEIYPLIKDKTIVPTDFDDVSYIESVKRVYDCFPVHAKKPNFVIFTTTKCDARCPYCFEHGQRRIDMSEQTAKDVARFMAKKAVNKAITIKWFGGEPLFNQKAMDTICRELQNLGISYNTKATTNGYLLNENIIPKAIDLWHLKSAVITLDGTAEVYNKTKNFIYDDTNAFETVLGNIEALLKTDIRVFIRLNVGFENFKNIKELVLYLNKRLGKHKKLSVIPIALYDLEGKQTDEERLKMKNMLQEIEELTDRSNNKIIDLRRYADMGTRCMAEDDDTYLISPIGELGTCEHFSEGEMMYGSIYSDKEDMKIKNYFRQRTVTERCKTCPLLPNCGGVGKCPSQTHGCDAIYQSMRLKTMDDSMIVAYKKYLKEKGTAAE